MAEPMPIAQNAQTTCQLLPGLANRHGLITGATGTGKTVTLQTLAEQFSRIGVPVFMADVKGDLTGISQTGKLPEKIVKVLADRGITPTEPQAWFHPVHFQVGMDQVSLTPAHELDAAISQQLFDALAPLCREDGVELSFVSANRWRARGERLRGLSCASLDRVAGRSVAAWQPRGPQAPWLRRLQSEAQMLFYTHPANDALESAGRAPVNGFWADGVGALASAPALNPPPRTDERLKAPALAGDWASWARAWEALDATAIADLLACAQRGEPAGLIVCGERRAVHLAPKPPSWLTDWTRRLRRPAHPASLLETL